MDHYISEFQNNMGTCEVLDYAVYMQKQTGFARFNPFASAQQLVVYVTNRGCYCCRIQSMGEFTRPVPVEQEGLQMSADGRQVFCTDTGKTFGYIRKCKGGAYASLDQFAAAVREACQ